MGSSGSAAALENEGADVSTAVGLERRMERRGLALRILEMQVATTVDELGDAVSEILKALLEAHDHLSACECTACDERFTQLDAQIVRALTQIQFEDRVRQTLTGVRKALHLAAEEERLLVALLDGAEDDGRPPLDLAMFETYVTETQRRIHRGEGGEVPQERDTPQSAAGLTLF